MPDDIMHADNTECSECEITFAAGDDGGVTPARSTKTDRPLCRNCALLVGGYRECTQCDRLIHSTLADGTLVRNANDEVEFVDVTCPECRVNL